jgi:hypothetical protein
MIFALIGERGVGLIALLFYLWMIYECMRRETGSERILWLLLVVFAPEIGSLIYFLVRVVKVRG